MYFLAYEDEPPPAPFPPFQGPSLVRDTSSEEEDFGFADSNGSRTTMSAAAHTFFVVSSTSTTCGPGIGLCRDITAERIPLPDHCLQGIHSEHCFEHLERSVPKEVLWDYRRLLTSTGTVRLTVPDAEVHIDLYVRARNGEAVSFPYVEGTCLPIDPLNRIFRQHWPVTLMILSQCGN